MLVNTLSKYTSLEPNELERLLAMSSRDVFADSNYQGMVDNLDKKLLESTVINAREAYRGKVEEFSTRLENKYELQNPTMSAFTLANWLIGFLYSPDNLIDLLEHHDRVPKEALVDGLPEILDMLGSMDEGRDEWQHAMVLLSLPLIAG